MKKSILYSAVAVLCLATACSDDFIERSPELQISEESIFSSAERLEAAVEGVYARAKNQYFLGGFVTDAGDNRSDDMINYGNNGYTMRDTYSHAVNSSTIENDYMFYRAYLGINYANTIIDDIEDAYAASLPCDDATAKAYVQECKFIRSISFFFLSQLFGQPYAYDANASNIPMRVKAVTGAGENECPASTISQVLAQILADTEDCSALPTGFGADGFSSTKASQAAVHALRMRVYMCMQDWDNAIAEARQIEGFSLISSISTMFDSPYAQTAENIFSIPMADTDKSGSQAHPVSFLCHSAGQITCVNNINGIATTYGVEADARTGFLYNDANGYTYCEKFNEYSTRYEWIPIFRYAEILLNLSECYYNKGDETKAKEYLKQVRIRSIAQSADPLVTYAESGTALWTAIDNERRWEFLGEGLRGYDISRRAEDYRHPLTDGGWTVVATPADRTTYCWAFPLYETTVNTALSN
ncbi:MAG: RagB/SusD family nutrient uptake outer membrane protein [Parabacteroides sp.]|nr:RagB/SusD family nutrient uptake outer membrane protein [Parabacteroides sp.]